MSVKHSKAMSRFYKKQHRRRRQAQDVLYEKLWYAIRHPVAISPSEADIDALYKKRKLRKAQAESLKRLLREEDVQKVV